MDTNPANTKMLNTPLAKAVADLVWNWVDQPWGMQFDSGHCESEIWASELKDSLRAVDEAGMVHKLLHYIAERESYDSDRRGITPVRQLLAQHGYEVPPKAAMKIEEPKPAKRGLMGMFRR